MKILAFCLAMAGVFPTSATSMAAPSARDQNNASPSPGLSFEVATIKPVDPSYHFDGTRFWAHVNPGGASFWHMTPVELVTYAYEVRFFQVTGPEWARSEAFDIEAKFPEGADPNNNRRMLQTLIKERFKLSFHIEKKELESRVLIVGKHGMKLRPSLSDTASLETESASKPGNSDSGEQPKKQKSTRNSDGAIIKDMGEKGTQTISFNHETGAIHFERSKMTMVELADILSVCLGSRAEKIVDETGIQGTYRVAWDCPSPVQPPSISADDDLAAPPNLGYSSLARSLDAMGLSLEKRKTLQDVYVIDHIEEPSAN